MMTTAAARKTQFIAKEAVNNISSLRTAKLVVKTELMDRVDGADFSQADKEAIHAAFAAFLAEKDQQAAGMMLIQIGADYRELIFASEVQQGFFVTSNHAPCSTSFHCGDPQFASKPSYTQIFKTRAEAEAWADKYLINYDIPMILPVSLLPSFFNGEAKKEQNEYGFIASEDDLKALIKRESIDLNSVQLECWCEKPKTYTTMQIQNLERGEGLHDAIAYCAVQLYVTGIYKCDLSWGMSWDKAFAAKERLTKMIEGLKAA